MNKWWLSLLALAAVAGVPSCAVLPVTSLAMYESTIYRTEKQEPAASYCYRRGDCVYFPVNVTFARYKNAPLGVVIPLSGGVQEYSLPVDEDAYTETFYFLLSSKDAEILLGITLPEPPKGAAPYIEADDWDAASAVPVPILHPKLKAGRVMNKTYTPNGHVDRICKTEQGEITVDISGVKPAISAHALYKWPLAAVLAVGVDVPVFVLSCGSLVISMPFYAGYQCIFHDKTLSEGPFY
jgi:hypothetical protein